MPMKIETAVTATRGKWLNLFDVTYRGAHDRIRTWELATRCREPKCVTGEFARPDAVVIVPFHAQRGRLVITREYRVPLADVEYGFPAGLVDPGETVEAATARELKEETGLTVTRIHRVGPPVYSSAGMTDEAVAMVYVTCSGVPTTSGTTDSEQIEVLFVSRDDAGRLCQNPQLKFDAKAWLVLAAYAGDAAPWDGCD